MTWRTSRYKQMVIDLLKNNDTIVVTDTGNCRSEKYDQYSFRRYNTGMKNPFPCGKWRLDLYIRPDENFRKVHESEWNHKCLSFVTRMRKATFPCHKISFQSGILAGYQLDFRAQIRSLGLYERNYDQSAMEGTLMYEGWRRTASQKELGGKLQTVGSGVIVTVDSASIPPLMM